MCHLYNLKDDWLPYDCFVYYLFWVDMKRLEIKFSIDRNIYALAQNWNWLIPDSIGQWLIDYRPLHGADTCDKMQLTGQSDTHSCLLSLHSIPSGVWKVQSPCNSFSSKSLLISSNLCGTGTCSEAFLGLRPLELLFGSPTMRPLSSYVLPWLVPYTVPVFPLFFGTSLIFGPKPAVH